MKRFKMNLTTNQANYIFDIVEKFDSDNYPKYIIQSIGNIEKIELHQNEYNSIELSETFVSKKPSDDMTIVSVDCIILYSYKGRRFIYKDNDVYEPLLNFIKPYIREQKIEQVGL